jgi:hypothetical protein
MRAIAFCPLNRELKLHFIPEFALSALEYHTLNPNDYHSPEPCLSRLSQESYK